MTTRLVSRLLHQSRTHVLLIKSYLYICWGNNINKRLEDLSMGKSDSMKYPEQKPTKKYRFIVHMPDKLVYQTGV